MVHAQAEDVAVRLGPHAGHAARVGQQADLPEVGAVREAGRDLAVTHHDVHDALLDEVHLRPDRALLDYYVACEKKRVQSYFYFDSTACLTSPLTILDPQNPWTNFMLFGNVRRILKPQNCERPRRVLTVCILHLVGRLRI